MLPRVGNPLRDLRQLVKAWVLSASESSAGRTTSRTVSYGQLSVAIGSEALKTFMG